MNPPAAEEVGGAGAGEMGAGFTGLGSGSFNARNSCVNPPPVPTGFSELGAEGAKERSPAGFCWSSSEGKAVSWEGDAGPAEENMRVKEPGSLEDGGCGAGGADCCGGRAAGVPADWNVRVKAPGSLEDIGCGAGGAAGAAGAGAGAGVRGAEELKRRVNSPGSADFCGAGAAVGSGEGDEDAGTGEVPESALNICVKLLGASEDCGVSGSGAAERAGSGAEDAGFSMETWRKMFATPALGEPGDLTV